MMRWMSALLGLLLLSPGVLAVPPGYRYVGSLVVSAGRHVYWYWNPEFYQVDASGTSFVANMYARNLELDEERAFVAIVRCDSKTYRRADSRDPFDRIEEGDPVYQVWRTGCDGGRAVSQATRSERVNGLAGAASAAKSTAPVTPPSPVATASPPASAKVESKASASADRVAVAPKSSASAPAPAARSDERRADSCVKLHEVNGSQFGDASIVNTCAFAVEVAYCYKGGHAGTFDCPTPPRRMRVDSLGPGATRNLPEYKRGRNNGIALVACKGTPGSVFPVLGGDAGKTGCS